MATKRKRSAAAPESTDTPDVDAPTRAAREERRWTWIAVGVIAVGCAIRFWDLGGKSLWFDEALSLEDSTSLTTKFGSGFHPPLFYYALHAWARLAGQSDAVLRLIAAVPGAITVGVVFLAGRRLFSARAGAFAAAVLAVSSLHVEYSQEVRMYALATLFVAVAGWLLAEALAREETASPRERWAWAVAYTAAAYAGAATHYLAGFVIAAQALALVLAWRETRALVVRLAILQAPAVAVAAVVLAATGYLRKAGVAADFFVTAQGVNQTLFDDVGGRLVALPRDMFAALVPGLNLKWLAIASYRWGAIALFDLVAVVAAVALIRRRDASLAARFVTLSCVLVPLVAVDLMVGPDQLRFFVAATPFLALVVGGGLDALRPRPPVSAAPAGASLGVASLVAVVALSSLAVWWYFDPGMDKQPWRRVASLVGEQARPGDVVLVNEPHLLIAFERYYRAKPGVDLEGYPEIGGIRITPEDLDRWFFPLVRDRARVWYVRMSATASHSDPDELALKWLSKNMRPVSRLREPGYNGDIEVVLFER